MPKTTGKAGIGVVLQRDDGSLPQTFVDMINVTNLEAGGVSVNMIDATQLNSPDFYAEFIPGLKTSDEWTMTMQWDPSNPQHSGRSSIRQQMDDRKMMTYRINTLAVGWVVMIEADCYISQLGNISFGPESILTQTVTLRPSGQVRFLTPATPIDPPPTGQRYVVTSAGLYEVNQSGAYVVAPI